MERDPTDGMFQVVLRGVKSGDMVDTCRREPGSRFDRHLWA